MRHPFDVAWSPEASSSTPAFCSSSWYFAISPRIFSCGITPASESFVAFTTIMNRMILSPLLLGLGCRRAHPLFVLPEFGLELGTEVVRFEDLANLDLEAVIERRTLEPLDRLFLDFTCHSQKPAISSFVSANGPSITVRLLPENRTRAPFELACSPSAASSTPAFASSSLNF